jgi:hypothetical protein
MPDAHNQKCTKPGQRIAAHHRSRTRSAVSRPIWVTALPSCPRWREIRRTEVFGKQQFVIFLRERNRSDLHAATPPTRPRLDAPGSRATEHDARPVSGAQPPRGIRQTV